MYKDNKIAIIIPARYASSRFSGKPLALIKDKPMIRWVYERAKKSRYADHVIVATDDKRILDAVTSFGGKAVMTSPSHTCGTDRVAEAAKDMDVDVIVDLQGDEPLVNPELLDKGVKILIDEGAEICTPAKKTEDYDEIEDRNVVKVIKDIDDYAIYFSRSKIPFESKPFNNFYKHIGIFFYRKKFLLDFISWPRSPLEIAEDIHQLRMVENGCKIKLFETDYVSHSVNTKEDIDVIEKMLSKVH